MSQSNSTSSPFVYYCSEVVLPPEYFLTSILITGSSLLLVLSLLAFVAVKAKKVKVDATKRTWITALDFIGGIGGVDSIFEPYENFLGKNREELEKIRQDNPEQRRHSEPGWQSQPSGSASAELGVSRAAQHCAGDQRSRSNMERVRLVRSDSDEEAEFYLRVLQYPSLLAEHSRASIDQGRQERSGSLVSTLKRRMSVTSTESGDSPGTQSESCPVTPSMSRVSRSPVTSTLVMSHDAQHIRTLRSSRVDEGVTKRNMMYRRKKPSVIQEV